MIWLFLAVALLCAAHMPSAPAQAPPPEEIRIGEVAEIAEPDNVKDANAENGWYRKTKYGWIFKADAGEGDAEPPNAELAAFVSDELWQSAIGLLLLAAPFVAVIQFRAKRRKKRADVPQGASPIEYQALMRQLSGIAQILNNVVPDGNADGVKTLKKVKRK